jgi:hypothetical protein
MIDLHIIRECVGGVGHFNDLIRIAAFTFEAVPLFIKFILDPSTVCSDSGREGIT